MNNHKDTDMQELILPGYTRISEIIHDFETLSKVPTDNLNNARDRGTRIDRMAKAYIEGLPAIQEQEQDKGFFESFRLWAEDKLPDLEVGRRLYDPKLMITGEPDFIWSPKGKNIIVDIKCTAKESPLWVLQGTGYELLHMANSEMIHGILFLRLKKDGKMPTDYHYESNPEMFMHFYYRHKYLGHHKDSLDDYLKFL